MGGRYADDFSREDHPLWGLRGLMTRLVGCITASDCIAVPLAGREEEDWE